MNNTRLHSIIRIVTGLAWLALLGFGAVGQVSAASIIYVKPAGSGAHNGTSWANAYAGLQPALAAAVSGTQIWVAKGAYKPTTGTDRTQVFTLKNGVSVYGGFAGTETLLSQRNPTANLTFLSGDIGTVGDNADNSYSVVSGGGTNKTAILDGFRIAGGQADCGCFPGDAGGGVFNWSSSPTLRNLVITKNATAGYGGGMYNGSGSHPTLVNVTFSANTSLAYGGGMYNNASNPVLTKVTFSGNKAISFGYGGGMYNDASSPTLTTVTFSANTSINSGGAMYNKSSSHPSLTKVTFSGNQAATYGGGIYNDTSNPTLKNTIFLNNSASNGGGGIYNYGSGPILTNATFQGNSGANGGGIENYSGSNPTLRNVTFYANSASAGGGMYNNSSSPALINTTFSANSATLSGPALDNDVSSGTSIYDSLFWGDNGGEIWNASPGTSVADSIVAGGCPGASTCTNVDNSDPVLGPLQANGGFGKTMALGAGSAAIDAGNAATCWPSDQRGVLRPQGGACDIGAYEVRAMAFHSTGADDGWVTETAQGSLAGGALNSTAPVLRVGDDAANRRLRGLLSFDTSPLPDTATPVMALMRVTLRAAVGNPFTTQGNLVTDVAKPYFGAAPALEAADWQAAAAAKSAGNFLQDGGSFWTPLKPAGLANIDLTATTQFRLRFGSDTYNATAEYLALYSGDYTTLTSPQPTLTVYYNP